jgi:hypothetical protein
MCGGLFGLGEGRGFGEKRSSLGPQTHALDVLV